MTPEIEKLKMNIIQANMAYRAGNPIMSDYDYDDLLDNLRVYISDSEYDKFVDTLNEGMIETTCSKIKHPFIMGSLDKIKSDDEKALYSFIKDYHISESFNISAKVDGISCRIRYVDGFLKEAVTRGDGFEGIDCTEKIKYISNIPKRLYTLYTVDIRGELVIPKAYDMGSSTNKRNICAGIINRKSFIPTDMLPISFIAYTILGDRFTKEDQFKVLSSMGFQTARSYNYPIDEVNTELLVRLASVDYPYDIDGLVICDSSAKNELVSYRPKNMKAFKVNRLCAETTLTKVVFEGPSKDGYLIPVAEFEPVELGGASIRRATLHNMDYIHNLDLKIGDKILVQKMNDIIPAVTKVVEKNEHRTDIEIPNVCPCCGSELIDDGLNYRCMNTDKCPSQNYYKMERFVKKVGIENLSFKTLESLKIASIKDLLSFEPNSAYKSELIIFTSICSHLFSHTEKELFCAMNFIGLSEKLLSKIVDFYGLDTIKKVVSEREQNGLSVTTFKQLKSYLPEGIGETLLQKFVDHVVQACDNLNLIVQDIRYNPIEEKTVNVPTKGSICVTGKLIYGSRDAFLKMAEEHGYTSKSSVSSGLTYLINNDNHSNSSKNLKAKKLGVPIITEDEFMKLIS